MENKTGDPPTHDFVQQAAGGLITTLPRFEVQLVG